MESKVPPFDSLPRHPHALPVACIAHQLGVDPVAGLNGEEAERRLKRFGPNFLAMPKYISDMALIL
ncbi:MAG TPA: cation-transporting P-type ATPase, partial [Mesorhizobium sp.]|nr:cation-transporting P-type ATPase [Mesorhizobium sp.]